MTDPLSSRHSVPLSVVVPAYDEEHRLGGTLERIRAYVDARGVPVEVIVVDDGSRDRTAAIAHAAGATVVALATNRGKGAAARAGVLAASGEQILLCDADLATPIEELVKLEAAIGAGADIAIGSRRMGRTIEVDQPFARRVLGRGFRQLVRSGLGITARDTMCGFKLFTRAAGHDLFARGRVERFAFDVELLYLAQGRYRLTEVAVEWRHVGGSRVALRRDVVRSALDLVAIRLRGMNAG